MKSFVDIFQKGKDLHRKNNHIMSDVHFFWKTKVFYDSLIINANDERLLEINGTSKHTYTDAL